VYVVEAVTRVVVTIDNLAFLDPFRHRIGDDDQQSAG